MSKKYLWFLIIISLILLTNIVDSDTVFPDTTQPNFSYTLFPNSTFIDLHNKIPSYKIIIVPDTITANLGDTIKVEVFISGFGYILNNKIHIFTPQNLLNPENPGLIGVNLGCAINNTNNITHAVFREWTAPLLDPKFSITPCNFMSIDSNLNPSNEFRAPPIMSEYRFEGNHLGYKGEPPIYVIMNIADNAASGDRGVDMVFTYTDGIEWYQDKEKITIHVNNPVEQYRTYLLIILAILAVPWFSEYTKEKYQQLLSSRFGLAVKIIRYVLVTIIFYLFYKSL